MGSIISTKPLEKISSDIFGPFDLEPFLSEGKGYILTITDILSRFSKLIMLKDISSKSIVRAFKKHWLNKFKTKSILVCDQGKQYTSNIFRKFCSQNNIKFNFCTTYNPTANGISERINSSMATG